MPPKRRRSVSTVMTRAPPASYSRGERGGVGDVGQLALGGAAALDLGDDRDAGRAERGEGVQGRAGVQRGRLDLGERDERLAGGEVLADAGDDLVEHAHGVAPRGRTPPAARLHCLSHVVPSPAGSVTSL